MLRYFLFFATFLLAACDNQPWNNPYPHGEAFSNTRYGSFAASPKTLDPAKSYSEDEGTIIGEIYEPPLQYHYLKRPFTLVPLTTTMMPKVTYLDKDRHQIDINSAAQVAYSVYDIEIKPGIYYQPHPAFAKDSAGKFYYREMKPGDFERIKKLSDFKKVGTRELVAEDYVYEIKRLAAPNVNSPIYGVMANKIEGFSAFSALIPKKSLGWIDLRNYPLKGVEVVDKYHYRITLQGNYPQFNYWLAMRFFAPIPWEADAFYAEPLMVEQNITFDWYPIGTGPYMLIENNPNKKMVLQKNPNFHDEYFPTEGEVSDRQAGYLNDAGKKLPFIDQIVFTLEKESIPRWNKFLQGYYDLSTISSDSFDQAIQVDSHGDPDLTPQLRKMGVYLQTNLMPAITYMGFNMLDDVVGGNSERARKLRLAISIAVDFEEYINIFLNGRGMPAQGPLPPMIFGSQTGQAGINPYVFKWVDNAAQRKSIGAAKALMREAGYPNGIDPATGNHLILNYDLATTGGPDEKALLNWLRKQFAKVGIQLNIRSTEYNRFQQKMRLGKSQIYIWGWIADYPDPENFLFLLYGPHGKVLHGGENASNYQNPNFDVLFDQMKNMPNSPAREQTIAKMIEILRHDAPWVWGVYQKEFILNQVWNYPAKSNVMVQNSLKYQRLDPHLREQLRVKWNKRVLWPLGLLLLAVLLVSLPVVIRYVQKERASVKS